MFLREPRLPKNNRKNNRKLSRYSEPPPLRRYCPTSYVTLGTRRAQISLVVLRLRHIQLATESGKEVEKILKGGEGERLGKGGGSVRGPTVVRLLPAAGVSPSG